MVGLLDLPSELLFEIINLVLSSPPGSQQDAKRHRPNWKDSKRNVWCIPTPGLLKKPGILDLLLLNRRMYTETREYLAKAPQSFDFDIAILDDHWLWPTSRFVPPRRSGRLIHRLNLNFVPCCTEDERHLQTVWKTDADQDRSGHCSMPFILNHTARESITPLVEFLLDEDVDCTFPNILLNLTSCQDYDAVCDTMKLPIARIDTITISIDTSKYKTGNDVLGKEGVPFRAISGLSHLDFERLYPLNFAKSKTYLLHMRSYITHWTSLYGAEKIAKKAGRIQFDLDGRMLSELNFDQQVKPGLS